MRFLLHAFVIGTLGFAATAALAAPIVDFGENTDYVADNANLSFGRSATSETTDQNGDADTSDAYVPFSTATALSPTSGYSGPTFYGGYFNNNARSSFSVRDSALSDTSSFDGIWGGKDGTTDMLVVFLKDDFLNGSSSGETVGFTAGDSLAASLGITTNASLRLVARNGSDWYISTTSGSSVSGDPSAAGFWRQYALSEGDALPPAYDAGATLVNGTSLTNVTAVGVLISTGSRYKFHFDDFSADATVVPEPGTLALLGLGGMGVLIRRRRA